MSEAADRQSRRNMLAAAAAYGGASLVSLLTGFARFKVLALLLGPAGVGLAGIFQNLLQTGSTLAGAGLSSSAVRSAAELSKDPVRTAELELAVRQLSLGLGGIGFILLWLFAPWLSQPLLGDSERVTEIRLLACALPLATFATGRIALLQGWRRVKQVTLITVCVAILSAMAGIAVIALWGTAGVVLFVLVQPLLGAAISGFTLYRTQPRSDRVSWRSAISHWRDLLEQGVPVMLSALLGLLVILVLRSVLVQRMGLESSGYFQAVWAVTATYVTLVLGALGADYFPALSGLKHDNPGSCRLIARQLELSVLLVGPILALIMLSAPWVLQLLYSKEFLAGVPMLRWQVMGDLLKVASWPLGFVLLARGHSILFLATELLWNLLFLVTAWALLETRGLQAVGIGFVFAHLVYWCLVWLIVNRLLGYRQPPRVLMHLGLFAVVLLILKGFSPSTLDWQFVWQLGLVAVVCGYALLQLNRVVGLRDWLLQKLGRVTR